MNTFDTMDPAERVVLTFDFSADLADYESLSGTPTVTVVTALGTDASPSAILNGTPGLDAANGLVLVPVKGGLADHNYDVRVVVETTNPNKVLTLVGRLPVRSDL